MLLDKHEETHFPTATSAYLVSAELGQAKDRAPITPNVCPSLPFMMCHAQCIRPLDPSSSKWHMPRVLVTTVPAGYV